MGDTSGLPGLTPTVDLSGGAPIQGDPLEFMQQKARTSIDVVNKNTITKDEEKLEFKREVLKRLKASIDKFKEIEAKYAAQEEEELVTEGEDAESDEESKDPFADIFGGDTTSDEATQEKTAIAQAFASDLKIYKTDFLRKIRVKRESEAKIQEEKKLVEILGQLENVNKENEDEENAV